MYHVYASYVDQDFESSAPEANFCPVANLVLWLVICLLIARRKGRPDDKHPANESMIVEHALQFRCSQQGRLDLFMVEWGILECV